ncbi:MAG: Vitamin B12 dependent methionine synthase activation subunit [Eubacteriales bacterium]|nr:Vitamin B12 dependent methionine synthase activation subunit [Eubacteriales bacterium]
MNCHFEVINGDCEYLLNNTSVREGLRYCGCRDSRDEELYLLAKECLGELCERITPKAVCVKLPVKVQGSEVDFGFCRHESKSLVTFLKDSRQIGIFCATLGVGADMLISRYSPILPSKAVITDGVAGALIECFCDKICEGYFKADPRERFSPGYGDLPLEMQKYILTFTDANLKIGLTLTDSMLLTPTKSVTAIVKL